MRNLSMFKKLTVGFVTVFMMTVMVASFGLYGMNAINVADDRLYNSNLLAVDAAGSIMENYANQRSVNRDYVLYNSTAQQFKNAENNLKKLEAEMETYIANYQATIEEEFDAEQFKKFTDSYYGDFKNLKEQLYQLGLANEQEKSLLLLDTTGVKIANDIDNILDECYQYNKNLAKETVEGNTAFFHKLWLIEIVLLIVTMLVCFFFEFYISALTSKPATFMKDILRRIGTEGNLAFSDAEYKLAEQYAAAKDELGQSVDMMLTMVRRLVKVGGALETVAQGDLTAELPLLSERDTMGRSLKKMSDGLNDMFGEIHGATVQVAAGARQLSDGSQSLSRGSTEQAASVEELNSAITEVTGKTKDTADMAHKASRLVESIKDDAENSNRQMDAMLDAVREINDASHNISKVIKVIDDIAFQTNILALNAAVEAARAGQHGKGFAVVAEEVRNLASKSAEAAKDTGSLISSSIDKAELGARIAGETASSLSGIVTGINESTGVIVQIAKSSEEQSLAIAQISDAINQVANVVQQNSATSEESAAASEEMSGQSDLLEGLISRFKLKDKGMDG